MGKVARAGSTTMRTGENRVLAVYSHWNAAPFWQLFFLQQQGTEVRAVADLEDTKSASWLIITRHQLRSDKGGQRL